MERYDAIYARQSVDRADSISTESQAEFCRRETAGEAKVYTDRGYSGKNTDRPAFQQLMKDVKDGKVRRVLVYRLDRISRSVLDFANVIEVFQKHGVDFVSTTEKFDTGTPIGKAMLMIVMIFAQLERETIQKRVADAYASRSRRGFYMGGRVPFGFRLRETAIDGVPTKRYEAVGEEAAAVRLIFASYAEPQASLGDVTRLLGERGIVRRDGRPFGRTGIRDVVVNPAYVRADCRLYAFLQAQGAQLADPPEDFLGTNGLYLYSGGGPKRKTLSLEGHTLVLAPHEGLVDSQTWIRCRLKCLGNQPSARPARAKGTWLAGRIKCGECGYALTAKVARRKRTEDRRYYLCSHKYAAGACRFGSLDADLVDGIVLEEMKGKLAEFQTLFPPRQDGCGPQWVRLHLRLESIEQEIASLLGKVVSANETLMDYINRRISELDAEKKALCAQMAKPAGSRAETAACITGYMEQWERLSIDDKITVAGCLLERVSASRGKIEIRWKI